MIAKILALYSVLLLTAPVSGHAAGFTLTNPAVGEKLTKTEEYAGFGCDGQNISLELRWSNPPAGTKSFALTSEISASAPSTEIRKWLQQSDIEGSGNLFECHFHANGLENSFNGFVTRMCTRP